jgi:uncharacterized protein YycO
MAGDYFVVRTPGVLGYIIRWVTRSHYNHAGIIISDYRGGRVVEARMKGAVYAQLSDYDGMDRLISHEHLSADQRLRIVDAAKSVVGVEYGFADLLWLGLMQFGIKWKWVRKNVDRMDDMVCSQIVAHCYDVAGVRISSNETIQDVTPGDLAKRVIDGIHYRLSHPAAVEW